jgi:hypothetical protein
VFVREVLSSFPQATPMTTAAWLAPPGESTYRNYACSELLLAGPANVIRIERPSGLADKPGPDYRAVIKPTPPEAVNTVTVASKEPNGRGGIPHSTKFWVFAEDVVLYADAVPFLIVQSDGPFIRQPNFPSHLAANGPVADPVQEENEAARRFETAAENAGGRERLGCSAEQIGEALERIEATASIERSRN